MPGTPAVDELFAAPHQHDTSLLLSHNERLSPLTSMGLIFSPPRLMSSLMRPVSVRKPSPSRKPWSPVWNQPPVVEQVRVLQMIKKVWFGH